MFYTIQTIYFLKAGDTHYPVTHCPLTHHPHRPTIPTKPTHNPPHMTISPHDTNQICSCRLLFSIPMTTYPLPSKSWHSEFRTVVQGLVCLFVCFLPYNIGHFFFNSGIPTPNAPASRPWQYRPIGASGSQHQPIGARRVSRPPALPGINGHSQIPTDGSTLMPSQERHLNVNFPFPPLSKAIPSLFPIQRHGEICNEYFQWRGVFFPNSIFPKKTASIIPIQSIHHSWPLWCQECRRNPR